MAWSFWKLSCPSRPRSHSLNIKDTHHSSDWKGPGTLGQGPEMKHLFFIISQWGTCKSDCKPSFKTSPQSCRAELSVSYECDLKKPQCSALGETVPQLTCLLPTMPETPTFIAFLWLRHFLWSERPEEDNTYHQQEDVSRGLCAGRATCTLEGRSREWSWAGQAGKA